MITCRHVSELQDALLDGELSSGLAAEIHAHLLQCPECQHQIEMVRACEDVIAQDDSHPAVPEDFSKRLIDALAESGALTPRVAPFAVTSRLPTRRDRRKRFWQMAWSASAPAAAAFLLFAVSIWPTPTNNRGRGDVLPESYSAVDAVGVGRMVGPALEAVSDTQRAAQELNSVLRLSVEDPSTRARTGLERMTDGADDAETAHSLIEEILFQPVNELLISGREAESPDKPDDGVVRF